LHELAADNENSGYAYNLIFDINGQIGNVNGCMNFPMQLNDIYSDLIEAQYDEVYNLEIKTISETPLRVSISRGDISQNCIM